MKIIKLVLHRYKRFDLLSSETMTYRPESPYQLILGKNGIGKSSLLNELSPLPVTPTDLKEDGYKEIKIEHRGHHYILKNTLMKKLHSSFIRDGKELNEGGTTKAQKDLIMEHFNYDLNLHDILMGTVVFSQLTPQSRREWFVKMSQSDMTYAIQLFNRIKGSERDIKGAIKINNSRIVTEKAKLPDEKTIHHLKDTKTKITDELNQLLPHLDRDAINTGQRLLNVAGQLEQLSAQIIDSHLEMAWEGVKDVEVIREIKTRLDYELERNTSDYRKTLDELNQIQEIIRKATEDKKRPIAEIDREIEALENEVNGIDETISHADIVVGQDNYTEKLQFEQVKGQLSNILLQLPENPKTENGYKYSREDYEQLRNEINRLGSDLARMQNELGYYHREVDQMRKVHDVHCPNCNHTFKPGIDSCRVTEYEKKIRNLEEVMKSHQKRYDELKVLDEEYSHWLRWMNALTSLPERYPTSVPLLNYLHRFDLLQENPKLLIQKVIEYERIVDLTGQKNQIVQYLERLGQERTRTLAAEGNDMEYVYASMKRLEIESETLQRSINQLNQQVVQIRQIIINHECIQQWEHELWNLLEQIQNDTMMFVRWKNNQYLNGLVVERQQRLAENETYLNQVERSESVIDQLETTNVQLKEEQEALAVLTKILSPQDGLIAESLLGFMNTFLDQLTNILDQVWTYSMRPYLDLGEDGIELDYRFPVDVNDGNIYVNDISRLSRGQMEMVNFGFKLLLMQYLDLQDYPLVMDEIGASFDSQHRDRLYQYIKRLVESQQTHQVFIISHIASSHDALSQADRCILDPDTVMVDDKMNKVLTFS